MGVEIIRHEDPLGLRITGHGLLDMVQKVSFGARRTDARGNDLTGRNDEIGDQAHRAMALI